MDILLTIGGEWHIQVLSSAVPSEGQRPLHCRWNGQDTYGNPATAGHGGHGAGATCGGAGECSSQPAAGLPCPRMRHYDCCSSQLAAGLPCPRMRHYDCCRVLYVTWRDGSVRGHRWRRCASFLRRQPILPATLVVVDNVHSQEQIGLLLGEGHCAWIRSHSWCSPAACSSLRQAPCWLVCGRRCEQPVFGNGCLHLRSLHAMIQFC